jgi:hypothetical protein
MNKKPLISFLAGFLIGNKGIPWFIHLSYISTILLLLLKVFKVF